MYSARFPQFLEVGSHFMDPTPATVKEEEVENVCRICESLDNLVDISTEEFSHLNEKLHKISKFEDSYSSRLCFICVPCSIRLENAYEFKVQCEETYQRLVTGMNSSSSMDSYYSNVVLPSTNRPSRTKTNTTIYQVLKVPRNQNQRMIPKILPRKVLASGSFACAICNKTYETKWKLTDHMQRMHLNHKQYSCIRCREPICRCTTQYKQKNHQQQASFPCNICGRVFRTKAYRELHEKDRHPQRNDNQNNLKEKYRPIEHIAKNPVTNIYSCDLCEKTFQRRQGLRMHYQIHTDERPHTCVHCQKAFRCRSHLNRHLITHTGEKRYKCLQCGKSFTQSGSLRIHERIHTGEKPYSCSNCSMTFRIRKMMINHVKTCYDY